LSRGLLLAVCWSSHGKRTNPTPYDSIPPYKRWGSVAELTCHLQGFTPDGIRFSHITLQAVADQGCHSEGSSPYKGTAYRGVYCTSTFYCQTQALVLVQAHIHGARHMQAKEEQMAIERGIRDGRRRPGGGARDGEVARGGRDQIERHGQDRLPPHHENGYPTQRTSPQ
jgi:hypothetical protein